MTIHNYIDNLNQRYTLGNATEHTFRGDLQNLLETLVPEIRATNEPKRQACGAPDYILTKRDIPVGFIEAKDIGDKDLEGKKKSVNKEQFDRYKASLNNLIFTDYLDFHLYRDGEFITKIAIAEITDQGIVGLPENFERFTNLLKDFCVHVGQNIKSPKKLAEMMAGKARLLSDIIEKSLTSDEDNNDNSTLREQKQAFKEILIHDITPKGFADVYAQTIAYGMFAARLHDPTINTFSRQEAAELIPKSNPFLRKLFGYIAGPDIDDRIKWIVENLTEIFLACNVEEILKNYGKSTQMEDPIIHFYETFLAEYDPALRKARGVWYTPAPVVNFIVRAVDDILKTEFDLPQGLADTSKTKINIDTQTPDKRSATGYKQIEKEVHKVQILDPATGTGTFLAEVIKHVNKKFKGQEGIWSSYVENDLLPRLNGFELLMASYAMAHLQLDLLLKETGFKPTKDQRTRVYLTNSLEEYHPDTGTLFANWLSSEANEANHIKRDSPVMCVIGNPPYNRTSNNSSKLIVRLLDDYKRDLNERNLVPLDDDYIKFIKYGQHYIDKNGEGILAYISSNSFVDGVTHRQMRKNLLETFDKVYLLNLHGNAKKREKSPDGSTDQNVFDIMTGVSINIFIKTKENKKKFGEVFQYDLYGKRESKYSFLQNSEISNIDWTKLELKTYFEPWIKFDGSLINYDKYLLISDIFNDQTPCIRTHNDKELVSFSKFDTETNQKYLFKAFDNRFVDFDLKKIGRSRIKVMHNILNKDNISLIYQRGCSSEFPHTPFITKLISDQGAVRPGTTSTSTMAPLYIYPIKKDTIFNEERRKPNLNQQTVIEFEKKLDLSFTNEKEATENTFAPIDILDYIYAVLHSPTYREKYNEFLKIDFPRVPYPKDAATFWQLVKLGGEIRQIHLLESDKVEDYITSYPIGGDNKVTRKLTKNDIGYEPIDDSTGRVWINDEQYFDNVPLVAWEFYIGGYQPAQKWLKDRKDRTLEFEDILHYQKIIVALTETDRLMKEIDEVEIE